LAGGFDTCERYKEVPFSNAPKAAFPAHAKRCLKQDGNRQYMEMPSDALRHKKMRNQLLQVYLKD